MDRVLFHICLVFMPSSSRSGGSSSKPAPIPMAPVGPNWGAEKEVEEAAAAEPTSKDMKGMPGFEDRGG